VALSHLVEQKYSRRLLGSLETMTSEVKVRLGIGFRQICCWGVQLLFHSSLN